ncbi:SDR family oxidoreductase [Gordonia sp. DT218]|uniref:SDR family oxidoreductase n=1 Tax=Gordonia sp. DT218 TaxID=3416659 RepID=UPI003CF105BF
MTTYAVTGATGGLGGSAVRSLLERGAAPADVVAIVRSPEKAEALRDAGVTVRVADYGDVDALTSALTGVDRLFFVSGSEVGQRTPQHTNVIAAAKTAGVGFVAYSSILDADTNPLALAAEHLETEKLIADSGLRYSFLRNNWYWDNYVAGAGAAIESGILYGAAGDGKVAGAARDDYAAAAAAVLLSDDPRPIYELAGSQRLDYTEIAATIAEVSGTPIRYENLPEQAYAAALEGNGVPAPFAGILANSDAGIAVGALDSDSTDLADLLGRPLVSLADVLKAGLALHV